MTGHSSAPRTVTLRLKGCNDIQHMLGFPSLTLEQSVAPARNTIIRVCSVPIHCSPWWVKYHPPGAILGQKNGRWGGWSPFCPSTNILIIIGTTYTWEMNSQQFQSWVREFWHTFDNRMCCLAPSEASIPKACLRGSLKNSHTKTKVQTTQKKPKSTGLPLHPPLSPYKPSSTMSKGTSSGHPLMFEHHVSNQSSSTLS